MQKRKAILALITVAVGVTILSGAGAAWHISLGMDTTEYPSPANASSSSEYALEFTEGGTNWNFDEVRIFFDGDVSLSQLGGGDITFLRNGEQVSVAAVESGEPTAAEQDITNREWDRVLRVELSEEMAGTESYRIELDNVGTPTSPGLYNLTLNTYIDGDLSTNRNGPDASIGNKEITYEIYEAQNESSNLLLYLLLLAAAVAAGYYYYRRRTTGGVPAGGQQPAPAQHSGQSARTDQQFQGQQANQNQGYNQGQQANQSRGYNQGQQANQSRGYNQGQQANQNQGYNQGQQANQNQGYNQRQQANQNQGYNQGQQANQNQGYNQGQQGNQNQGYNQGQQGNQNQGYNQGQQSNQNQGYNQGQQGNQNQGYNQGQQGNQNQGYNQGQQANQNQDNNQGQQGNQNQGYNQEQQDNQNQSQQDE
jgi:hypothetical protein